MSLIGVNLYSVRNLCQTIRDLDSTLGKIADIGYPSVQVSGIPGFEPREIRSILDKHGLLACACHENLVDLRTNFSSVLEKLSTLGVTFTALGSPGEENLSPQAFPELVRELDTFAKEFRARGIRFGYHNHAFEFQIRNTASLYEQIFSGAPALHAEPDTHWIQRGGGDSATWIRRLKGRVPAVHLKDYVWRDGGPAFAEVGYGNMYWDPIFEACLYAGVGYYIVEQDEPTPGRDILESLALSYNFLSTRMGV